MRYEPIFWGCPTCGYVMSDYIYRQAPSSCRCERCGCSEIRDFRSPPPAPTADVSPPWED